MDFVSFLIGNFELSFYNFLGKRIERFWKIEII